ncbi:MAG: hypothetical protein M3094_06525, partial [Actinomycetia bacterium]|nr:hypothetical protein [Actinomycetes bacterium]
LTYNNLDADGHPVSFYQAGAGDTLAPYLVAFSLTPTTIDTSSGPRTITITARLTDAVAGVSPWDPLSEVTFASPSGNETVRATFSPTDRVSGDANDGTYKVTVTVPKNAEQGTWTVKEFLAIDRVGNTEILPGAVFGAFGFTESFTNIDASDATAPQLAAFSITPSSVDTSGGDRTIEFRAQITDAGVGVSAGDVEPASKVVFVGPSGFQSVSAIFTSAERVSGTASNGVYEYTVTIPKLSEQGTWTVESFKLVDENGNTRELTAADLGANGYPTKFTQTGAGDTTPPELAAFSFTPAWVDPSGGDRTIAFTARITDDVAGVDDWLPGSVRFRSPSGGRYVVAEFATSQRVSGDALDGIYVTTATIPKGSEQGKWTVFDFALIDRVGNWRDITAGDLATSGFASFFAVTGPGGPPPPPPAGSVPTVGLVDPGTGLWYLRDSGGVVSSFYFGNPGDFPIVGDWDCDGVDPPGMYRQSDGYVYLRNSNTQGIADIRFFFGNPGDVPLAGDFNGDGCDTVSI